MLQLKIVQESFLELPIAIGGWIKVAQDARFCEFQVQIRKFLTQ